MTDETITRLFETCGLGQVILPVTSVTGGLMHRMFRVTTAEKTYAVKRLNPEIMKRPDAMRNFLRAEELEEVLENAGIPIVPAIRTGGRKMQETDGEYFYIFPWQNGRITDWHHITPEQCRQAGNIQGRIHAIRPRLIPHTEPEQSAIDWSLYIKEAERQDHGTASLLKENEKLLNDAQDAMNRARRALPDIECITDEDMDPKNVIWDDGRPFVIDLECLGTGNPVSNALQLSLQWAGATTCTLDTEKQGAFFEGYLGAYDNGFRDYGKVLGLAYTWIEWLEFNIRRALGQCQDESERETGASEVRNTINRIRHIHGMEDRVLQQLERLLTKQP